ncbi:hypothetical protein G9A89_007633 [Geosiphon pyriformis]|nr:hypothetical protein G9A89_007633 [Geosiphon pyriformis]
MAMAVDNCDIWASKNRFRALLFTLLVRIIAHDLGTLLDRTSERTCVINQLIESGNQVCCTVVGFEFEKDLESAFCTKPIFGDIKLSWARMNLVHCKKCGCFSYSALKCNTPTAFLSKSLKPVVRISSEERCLQLAKLYVKKSVLIFHLAVFGGKSWAQVVLLASSSGGSCFTFSSESGSSPLSVSTNKGKPIVAQDDSSMTYHLALLKHFLELLADQVLSILHRLNGAKLMFLAPVSQVVLPVVLVSALSTSNTNMVLDIPYSSLPLFSSVVEEKVVDLGLSSSKIFTSKVSSLELKMVALEVSIKSILEKLDLLCMNSDSLLSWKVAMCNIRSMSNVAKQEDIIINKFDGLQVFTSDLDVGFCGTGIAIIMNNSLARHVSKVDEIPGYLISVHFLFNNKLSVTILGIYAGVSIGTHFRQAANINSMISKAVNSSSFVVLGGNFNENGSGKSASFKFCLGLSLVNTFNEHSLAKASTWSNSKVIKKIIDFILVSGNLASAVSLHFVDGVSEFFDTDYKSVFISIGLGWLLDTHFISIRRQANRDQWKFKLKDADNAHWLSFKDCFSAKLLARSDMFEKTKINGDLNTIWKILKKAIVQAADTAFSRVWYSEYNCLKNKLSSKFFKLELLVVKVVNCWNSGNLLNFNHLIKVWLAIDVVEASKINGMVLNSVSLMELIKHLSVIKKGYYKSKYCKSKITENTAIKKAID